MLKKLLEQKKCFKLICGAGNENSQEIERLVALYASAGCHFFDLSASKEVFEAAQKGLDFAILKESQKDYHFCVSIGTKGDPHLQKVKIDGKLCQNCGKCIEICPQNAIQVKEKMEKGKELRNNVFGHELEVIKKNCIGCLKCQKVCRFDAIITAHQAMNSTYFSAESQLESEPTLQSSNPPTLDEKANKKRNCISEWPCDSETSSERRPLINRKLISFLSPLTPQFLPADFNPPTLACIELHASDIDEHEVDKIWEILNENFDGMLSLCIGRSKLSDEQILNRIRRLIKDRKPYTTIIQADGAPMSGGENDFNTTLQAVSMATTVQNANLPVYLMLSGGTNSKTADLARLCGVNFHGIAMGSYARKIVKKYIERDDFFENKAIFNEVLKIAQNLVQSSF